MNIELVQGDITAERVDAVVNAANTSLLGGGGVDGAIHRAAGPRLLESCREMRGLWSDGLPVGRAVVTPGFDLSTRFVIHTVGPNKHAGETDPGLLRSCFIESLHAAEVVGARSVAFPAISAGVYGWDMAETAEIALDALRGYAGPIELVRVVLFSADALTVWEDAAAR